MRRTLYKQVKCCYNVIIGIVLNTIYASIDIQSVSHLLSYSPKYGAYASLSGLDSLIKGNNFGKTKLVFFRFFISFLVVQLVYQKYTMATNENFKADSSDVMIAYYYTCIHTNNQRSSLNVSK